MAWKPKEKQLTPEEAVELARKELAPHWLGSEPLIAATRGANGRAQAHPLSKTLEKKPLALIFVDLTSLAAEQVLHFARDWHKRYSAHELGFVLVVRCAYRFIETARVLEPLLGKHPPAHPVALDREGLLLEAFGATGPEALPKVVLLHRHKVVFERAGAGWLKGTETAIQQFLRLSDPGLPLSLPIEPAEDAPVEQGRVDFGAGGIPAGFKVTGKWAQEAERWVTHDPAATLQFRSPAPRVSFVAQLALKAEDPSRMRIELNGDPVFDSSAGHDLVFADDGGSELKIRDARLYHALVALPEKARLVTLKFPDSDRLPVALHGVRFGK